MDPQQNKLVNDTVERFKKDRSIPTKIADGVITLKPRTHKFYISSKIHKENNLGGPVSTARHPKYVNYHLQPIMKEIPSYVKSTNNFINKINNHNNLKESILSHLM